MTERAAMPHCDSRVLHAPSECKHCDEFPDWQAAREAWGINFTGKTDPEKQPCPSEQRRPLERINRWPGNRPEPVARKLDSVPGGARPPVVTPISGGLVDDRSKLDDTLLPSGQHKTYLVLSDAERAKGYVRPVRTSYLHVGTPGPRFVLRELTPEELRFNEGSAGEDVFVKFEPYPDGFREKTTGRFWTQKDIDAVGKGCGTKTTMGRAIAETYARNFAFYGSTFCCVCRTHFPVGERGEFVWVDESGRVTDERVGT